jgi:hypothetical protein
MPSPAELLPAAALPAAALLAAVIPAVVRRQKLTAPGGMPGGGGGGRGPIPRASQPREKVEVHVDATGDTLRINVEPWVVDVENGKPLHWVLHSTDPGATMRIEPKDAGRWPFPGPAPTRPVPPGTPFAAGRVQGSLGSSWAYSIIVRTDGRDLEIDPEIFICF